MAERWGRGLTALLIGLSGAACFGAEDSTLNRGDEAFALGEVEEALAEYRLALRQRPDETEVLLRVARASAALRRVDDVVDRYAELVALEPRYEGQALSELLALARDAAARSDYREMALAVEAALRIEPGIGVGELAEPLGSYYYGLNRWSEASVYLGRALRTAGDDADPDLWYDLAHSYMGVGDCVRALPLFAEYEDAVVPRLRADRADVTFQIGDCSLELANTFFQEEDYSEALEHVDRMLDVRTPPVRIAEGYFLRGRILEASGECDDARRAYEQVAVESSLNTAPIVLQAEERINAIRFGRRGDGRRGGRRSGCT